jgi:hypothetical protein
VDPNAKNFNRVESNLFGLFEFCYDKISGFGKQEVLENLQKVREQILTYD